MTPIRRQRTFAAAKTQRRRDPNPAVAMFDDMLDALGTCRATRVCPHGRVLRCESNAAHEGPHWHSGDLCSLIVAGDVVWVE